MELFYCIAGFMLAAYIIPIFDGISSWFLTWVELKKAKLSEGINKYELGREGFLKEAWKNDRDYKKWKKNEGAIERNYSEALDNIVLKLYNAYIDSNGDKDLFAKKAEELLSGTLRQHVGSKKALKMSNKAIQGKNTVLKMIDKGASVEDIADVIYKQNGGVKLTAKEQNQIYNYLKEAKDFPEGSSEQEELLAKAAKIALARPPSTIGQKLRTILYTNMLGNFKTAINNYKIYKDWMFASKKTHEDMGGKSAGNGTLMRTAPIAFYRD